MHRATRVRDRRASGCHEHVDEELEVVSTKPLLCVERLFAERLSSLQVAALRGTDGSKRKAVWVEGMLECAGKFEDGINREAQLIADLGSRGAGSGAEQAQRDINVVGVDRVVHRGEQVLVLGEQSPAGFHLVRTSHVRGEHGGELGVVLGVPGPQHLGLLVFGEAFLAVLADRLQQPIPGLGTIPVGDNQRCARRAPRGARTPASASIGSPAHTFSAASRVQPPANTARRAKRRRSESDSNS